MFDYQKDFPLTISYLPQTLRSLLTLESIENPSQNIEVATRVENNKYTDGYEYVHMIMACIPENEVSNITVFPETTTGLVKEGTPYVTNKGGLFPYQLSVSGYDYIVASWGDSARYTYNLAEKVWMTLGLSPRLIGNSEQKIIYDDLTSPLLGVANGDVHCEYEFVQSKNIKWNMRNDYLRNYLWMSNCYGFRVFYYEAYIEATEEVIKLLNDQDFYQENISNWGELCIRKIENRILLQLHGVTCAVEPIKCNNANAYSLVWPGQSQPYTRQELNNYSTEEFVYVKDSFLEKYEKDSLYEAVPFKYYSKHFYCSPSYKGQWSFQKCVREGRNLVKISLYELYKGVPDEEIFYIHQFVITDSEVSQFHLNEENIVIKAEKFLTELCNLTNNLSKIDEYLTGNSNPENFSEFNLNKYKAEGFRVFPIFSRLYQVAPLNMYEQDFLSRCKTINEILMRLKPGSIKSLLIKMGVDTKQVNNLKTLKLLQILFNIVEKLDQDFESKMSFENCSQNIQINMSNQKLAPLFINNDLRNAEAHESVGEAIKLLENLGFDSSSLKTGYGKALDFILDKITDSLHMLNTHIERIMQR